MRAIPIGPDLMTRDGDLLAWLDWYGAMGASDWLGEHPVDRSLQSTHLTAMARVAPRSGLGPKLRAAGIFLAGLLVGGSGAADRAGELEEIGAVVLSDLDALRAALPGVSPSAAL